MLIATSLTRVSDRHVLSQLAFYEVASNVCQALKRLPTHFGPSFFDLGEQSARHLPVASYKRILNAWMLSYMASYDMSSYTTSTY
jgi:hypothetical protein